MGQAASHPWFESALEHANKAGNVALKLMQEGVQIVDPPRENYRPCKDKNGIMRSNGESWACGCGRCYCKDGYIGLDTRKCPKGSYVICGNHNAFSCKECGKKSIYCNGECKWKNGQCIAKDKGCKTTRGDICVFPFKYQGVLYDKCTQANHIRPWCSTSTYSNNQHISGKWGDCSSSCPSGEKKSCKDHNGVARPDGDIWTCADGCNSCWCMNGNIASTKKGCQSHEDICALPPGLAGGPGGYCWAMHRMWTFDKKSGECKKFIYGGCGGNENKFKSEVECLETCGGTGLGKSCVIYEMGPVVKSSGEKWACNGCNTCYCHDGKIQSTEMQCEAAIENGPCKPGRYSFEQCPGGNGLRCINNKCIKTDKGGPYKPCLPGKSDLEKCPAYEGGQCVQSWYDGGENFCTYPVN